MEGWSEIEDDVIQGDSKLSARSSHSAKSGRAKSPGSQGHKENSLKRQKGNHLFKRQKSKEQLSPTKSKSIGGKAKTPDQEGKHRKKSTSLKRETTNTTKRKISMKQDPVRYDNFLKSSSSYQRRMAAKSAKETSGSSGKSTSGSSIGPSTEKRLKQNTNNRVTRNSSNSRLINHHSPTVRGVPSSRVAKSSSSSIHRVANTSKRNTSVNRSTTVSKVRRKSSVRKIASEPAMTSDTVATTQRRMMTRSSSSNLSKESFVVRTPRMKKSKNLKRSIGRTSLEGKLPGSNETLPKESGESEIKRQRISSLSVPTISVLPPPDSPPDSGVPMSPSPFVFGTSSLSDKVGTRLCPLGKRSRLPQSSDMVGRFLRDHKSASVSVCSPVQEEPSTSATNQSNISHNQPPLLLNLTDNSAPRVRAAGCKLRRQSNFKLVRLNSVQNKRKSMLRVSKKKTM